MASLEAQTSNKKFLSIAQGSIRETVPEGTPNAVRRDWEAGGQKGTKWELVYDNITGRITSVDFFDGETKEGRKFSNINITFDEMNGKVPVLSVGLSTRYATDLLKKLPNVDFKEEVRLRPYSFIPDGEDKEKTGVSITQIDHTGNFGKKIVNFFHKKEGDKWVAVNGYPEPTDEDRSDWKFYYMKAERFLVQYTKANIVPKFAVAEAAIEYPEEVINPEDVPF